MNFYLISLKNKDFFSFLRKIFPKKFHDLKIFFKNMNFWNKLLLKKFLTMTP